LRSIPRAWLTFLLVNFVPATLASRSLVSPVVLGDEKKLVEISLDSISLNTAVVSPFPVLAETFGAAFLADRFD